MKFKVKLTVLFFLLFLLLKIAYVYAFQEVDEIFLNKNLLQKEKLLPLSRYINSKNLNVSEKISIIVTSKNVSELISKLDDKFKIKYKYNLINAVALETYVSELPRIMKLSEVDEIFPDTEVKVLLVNTTKIIGATHAWNYGYNGSGIKIAVLDTGIDKSHPDLKGKVFAEKDFTGEGFQDDHGHGTHVAGIISGQGKLYRGVAPGSRLMNVKVLNKLGYGWISDVISGIEWAVENGADVISMSLGGYGWYQDPLAKAVDKAVEKGIVVVVAAGNEGPFTLTIPFTSPSSAQKAITVGATTKEDKIAWYSSRGPMYSPTILNISSKNETFFNSTEIGSSFTALLKIEGIVEPSAVLSINYSNCTHWNLYIGDYLIELPPHLNFAFEIFDVYLYAKEGYLPLFFSSTSNNECLVSMIELNYTTKTLRLLDFIKPELVAPGGDVLLSVEDIEEGNTFDKGIISAKSINSLLDTVFKINYPKSLVGDFYIKLSGTSMAAPHVAGAVAIIKQARQELTPEQIKELLMSTADDIGYPPYIQGAGRVNLLKALKTNVSINPSFWFILKEEGTKKYVKEFNLKNYGKTDIKIDKISLKMNIPEAFTLTSTLPVKIVASGNSTIQLEMGISDISPGTYFGRIEIVDSTGTQNISIPVQVDVPVGIGEVKGSLNSLFDYLGAKIGEDVYFWLNASKDFKRLNLQLEWESRTNDLDLWFLKGLVEHPWFDTVPLWLGSRRCNLNYLGENILVEDLLSRIYFFSVFGWDVDNENFSAEIRESSIKVSPKSLELGIVGSWHFGIFLRQEYSYLEVSSLLLPINISIKKSEEVKNLVNIPEEFFELNETNWLKTVEISLASEFEGVVQGYIYVSGSDGSELKIPIFLNMPFHLTEELDFSSFTRWNRLDFCTQGFFYSFDVQENTSRLVTKVEWPHKPYREWARILPTFLDFYLLDSNFITKQIRLYGIGTSTASIENPEPAKWYVGIAGWYPLAGLVQFNGTIKLIKVKVSPEVIIEEIDAGSNKTFQLNITNIGLNENITLSSEGIAEWISFSEKNLSIPVGSWKVVNFSISIQPTAKAGTYYGKIFVANFEVPVVLYVSQPIPLVEGTQTISATIKPKEWYVYRIQIQQDVISFSTTLSWKEKANRLNLFVYDPKGNLIEFQQSSQSVKIVNPLKGIWTIAIYGADILDKEQFNLEISFQLPKLIPPAPTVLLPVPPPPTVVEEIKNIARISPKEPAIIRIDRSDVLKIQEIRIEVKATVSNVKITVRESSRPEKAPEPIAKDIGKTFKYLEITRLNLRDEDILRVKIKFKVEKSWISANEVDKTKVFLNRWFNSTWNKLPTNKINEDSTYVYYEAESPGLSIFAITGEILKKICLPYYQTRCYGNILQRCSAGGMDWQDVETCTYGCNSTTLRCNPPELKECPICPSPSKWSKCIDGKQNRTNYKCDATTAFKCVAYKEVRECREISEISVEGVIIGISVVSMGVFVPLLMKWKAKIALRKIPEEFPLRTLIENRKFKGK